MTPATSFAGRTVAVFGLGLSGLASCRALLAGGASVAAWDDGAAGRDAAAAAGIPVVDLTKADWRGFAALVLAPGVPLTHPAPHWTVERAKAAGVEIIGDVELYCRERAKCAADATFIAVTGTNGKSTTTALIAHLLRAAGRDVQMGGNIGTAILALEPPAPERCHVVEMSSYQIELTPSLAPSVGILLNVSPDHLDRHGTMEHYAGLKARLVQGAQHPIVGDDDDWCRDIAEGCGLPTAPGSTSSRRRRASATAGMRSAASWSAGRRGRARSAPSPTSPASARCAGATTSRMRSPPAPRRCTWASRRRRWPTALATFPGLPHRLEEIGRQGRTLFINDSKATNADSAATALAAFARDIHWILGGKPKEGGITSLAGYFDRVAKAYLIGEATEEFAATLEGRSPSSAAAPSMRAVAEAARDAAASGAPEPVVLLSPACASYDQYRNFEVRGDAFRALVAGAAGHRAAGPGMRLARAERSRLADWWFTVDRVLLAAILVIVGAGLVLSLAASPPIAIKRGLPTFYFVQRHVLFAAVGVGVMLAVSMLSPMQVRRLALAVLAVSLALMLTVLLSGAEIKGAKRWLHLGGYSLQPSEFAKPAFVLLSAWLFAEGRRRPDMPAMPLAILPLSACSPACWCCNPTSGRPCSSASVWCALFFLAGRPAKWLFAFVAALAGGLAAAYAGFGYVRLRIDRFLNPASGDSFQTDRALQSFIEGGFFGRGPGRGNDQDRAAGCPHRFHLRGDRRGVRRARLPGDPGPVRLRRAQGVLPPARGAGRLRAPRGRGARAAVCAACHHQHGGQHRAGAGQGHHLAADLERRLLDGRDGSGARHAAGLDAAPARTRRA